MQQPQPQAFSQKPAELFLSFLTMTITKRENHRVPCKLGPDVADDAVRSVVASLGAIRSVRPGTIRSEAFGDIAAPEGPVADKLIGLPR